MRRESPRLLDHASHTRAHLIRCMRRWAHLIKIHFSQQSLELKWNAMRPMLGGMHILYSTVHNARGEARSGVSSYEWRAMRRTNLFTYAEVDQLAAYKGSKPALAASWALGEVKAAIVGGGDASVSKVVLDGRDRSFDGAFATVPGAICH